MYIQNKQINKARNRHQVKGDEMLLRLKRFTTGMVSVDLRANQLFLLEQT